MQLDPQLNGLNANQIKVEQRVNVGVKQQAVLRIIVVLSAIRSDMRDFKHV